MYTGPHLIKDELVFGYDTGYGVADNNTATRFYPGESTENLVGNPTFIGTSGTQTQGVNPANWLFSGETGSTGFQFYNSGTSPIPLKFPNEGAVITTGSGTSNRRIYFRREDLLGNTTYTISCWMYFKTAFSSSWSKFQYDSSNTSLGGGYFDTFANYASANGYGLNEWFLWKGTLTTEATTAKCYWGPVISSSANVLVGMQRMQVETKGHVTPFVNGTRSSTQSLIDLKRTADIDVSNVSFDSTGQPSFDGTDDIINTGLFNGRNPSTDPFTIEAIVKSDTTSGSKIWLDATGNGSNQRLYCAHAATGTGNPLGIKGSAWSTNGAIYDMDYHHYVIVMDGSTATLYNNGVSHSTKNYTSYTLSGQLNVGGRSGYRWVGTVPVFKIHNEVLTADQVKQNYRAYKNRFGI